MNETVITYGTFDLFHVGHVRLLKRLANLGTRLVVGCSTDGFNELKGKRTIMSFEHRQETLLACRYIDDVFAESSWNQKRDDIARESASIFAMGDDWAGKFDELSDVVEVIYLPRTKEISSTEVKEMVSSFSQERKQEVLNGHFY